MISSRGGSICQEKLREVELRLLSGPDCGKPDPKQKLQTLRQSFLELIKGTELFAVNRNPEQPDQIIKWVIRMLKLFLLQLNDLTKLDFPQSQPKQEQKQHTTEEEASPNKAKMLGGVSVQQARGLQATSFRLFKRDFGVSTDEIFLPDENEPEGPDSTDFILAIDTFFLGKNLQKVVDYRPPNNLYESLLDCHEILVRDIKTYLKAIGQPDALPTDCSQDLYSCQSANFNAKKQHAQQKISSLIRKLLLTKRIKNLAPLSIACQTPTRFDLKGHNIQYPENEPLLDSKFEMEYNALQMKCTEIEGELQQYKNQVMSLNEINVRLIMENDQLKKEIGGLKDKVSGIDEKNNEANVREKRKKVTEKILQHKKPNLIIENVFNIEIIGIPKPGVRRETITGRVSFVESQLITPNLSKVISNKSILPTTHQIVQSSNEDIHYPEQFENHSSQIIDPVSCKTNKTNLQSVEKIVPENKERKSIISIDKVAEFTNINEISNIQQCDEKDISNATVYQILGQTNPPKKKKKLGNSKIIQQKLENKVKEILDQPNQKKQKDKILTKQKQNRSSISQANALSKFKRNSEIKSIILNKKFQNQSESIQQKKAVNKGTNATVEVSLNQSFSAGLQATEEVFADKIETPSSSSALSSVTNVISQQIQNISEKDKNTTLHNMTSQKDNIFANKSECCSESKDNIPNASISRMFRKAIESSLPQINHRRDSSLDQTNSIPDKKQPRKTPISGNFQRQSKFNNSVSQFDVSQIQPKILEGQKKKRQHFMSGSIDTKATVQVLYASQNTQPTQDRRYDSSKIYQQIVQKIKDSRDRSHKVSIYSKLQTFADNTRILRPSICMLRELPQNVEDIIPSDLNSDYSEFKNLYPSAVNDMGRFVQYVEEEHRTRCGEYCDHLKRFLGKMRRQSDFRERPSIALPKHTFQKLI